MSKKLACSLISKSSGGLIFALAMLFSELAYAQPLAAFVGDTVAFRLHSKLYGNTVGDSASGLSSRDIAIRVGRNKKVQNIKWAIISAGTDEVANPNTKIDLIAFEENLWTIREELKASEYVWLGAYDREVSRVVEKFAYTYGDWFVDLNVVTPARSECNEITLCRVGIQAGSYSDLLIIINKTTRYQFLPCCKGFDCTIRSPANCMQ